MQGLNISAHKELLTADGADCTQICFSFVQVIGDETKVLSNDYVQSVTLAAGGNP